MNVPTQQVALPVADADRSTHSYATSESSQHTYLFVDDLAHVRPTFSGWNHSLWLRPGFTTQHQKSFHTEDASAMDSLR